jgi:two-component system, OmpR family, copper resistance phosphate regulon response regulator CusR
MTKTKILLIQGEEKIAGEICKTLSEQDYIVDLAVDGSMGKQLFDAHSYGLVLVDFHLPDISGQELFHYFRKKDVHIPLIMLVSESANSKFEDLEAGIGDLILLSPDFKELLTRVRELTKQCGDPLAEPNRIESGDIILDLGSKEVIRGDKVILLTTKEFRILEYLVRNKNNIVTRADMAFSIWGTRFASKQGRLDVYMNSLRKKICDNTLSKRIYTVTRKGYILTENQ